MINQILSRDKVGVTSRWSAIKISKGEVVVPNDECDVIVVADKGYVDRLWVPQSYDNAGVLQSVPRIELGDSAGFCHGVVQFLSATLGSDSDTKLASD